MEKKKINWGDANPTAVDFIENEIFNLKCYESIFPVKEGDVVLDIGASIGPFTWDVMDRASKVYAVEPVKDQIELLKENTEEFDVKIFENVIGCKNGKVQFSDTCLIGEYGEGWVDTSKLDPSLNLVDSLTFGSLLKSIPDKINFIKTDCEGGEYYIFRDEYMPFLKNQVRTIVGEFHLETPQQKIEFRYFRDKYLPQFKNVEVRSLDNIDIKWDLWNEHFIEYYNQVIIHINNE